MSSSQILSTSDGVGSGAEGKLRGRAAVGLAAAPFAGWLAVSFGWMPILRGGLVFCIGASLGIALISSCLLKAAPRARS